MSQKFHDAWNTLQELDQNDANAPFLAEARVLVVAELGRLERHAWKVRKRATTDYLQLIEDVQALAFVIPSAKLRSILINDWGLGRGEALRLAKLPGWLLDHRDLLVDAGATPDVIRALASARPDVRQDMLVMIEAGRNVERADFSRMRRMYDRNDVDAQARLKKLFLNTQAGRTARSAMDRFRTDLSVFVDDLLTFHAMNHSKDGEECCADVGSKLATRGQHLLYKFETLFDIAALPDIGEWFHDGQNADDVRLAKAFRALSRIAVADFWDATNVTQDYDHVIERELIKKLAWLCDVVIKDDHLRRPVGPRFDPKEIEPLSSIEICAGAGGMAIGLHGAHFVPVAVVERNRHAMQTLAANYPFGPLHQRDIRGMDFGAFRDRVDLFAGGVPCQPHSAAGLRQGALDERDLFMRAVQIVETVRPRAVFLENVKGFGHTGVAPYRSEIFAALKAAGYEAELFPISASDYGLAQKRPRLVLIAFRDGLMSRFAMPPKFDNWKISLGACLKDMMAANGWQHAEAWAQKADGLSPTLVGGSERSGGMGFSLGYRLEEWAKLGVSARYLDGAAPSALDGPDHMPQLTLEMGARLQGFPHNWAFKGPRFEQRRQIANALPPIMAQAVGLAIRIALTGESVDFATALRGRHELPIGNEREIWKSQQPAEDANLPHGNVRVRDPRFDGFPQLGRAA